MKIIKILGVGCARCKKTESVVRKALKKYDLNAEIVKVEDYQQIMQYNTMATPVVVVDEEVKIWGKVPTIEEIRDIV